MANIKLKELLEANVDPKLVARSKKTGKLVYFKSPEAKAAAVKAGSHEEPKAKKGEEPKVDAKPNDMFGGDYAKDRGGEAPEDNKSIDGQTDDELYDALYDMGYDFGEYGTDDFDEEGFADAAMSLGYRWDDNNKVWYNRDGVDNDDSDVDGQTDDELYDALYDMGYDFGELGSDDFDEEGFADAAMSLGYRYDDKNKVWNHRDNVKESSTKLTSMIKK
jgi:hypothetical protein